MVLHLGHWRKSSVMCFAWGHWRVSGISTSPSRPYQSLIHPPVYLRGKILDYLLIWTIIDHSTAHLIGCWWLRGHTCMYACVCTCYKNNHDMAIKAFIRWFLGQSILINCSPTHSSSTLLLLWILLSECGYNRWKSCNLLRY